MLNECTKLKIGTYLVARYAEKFKKAKLKSTWQYLVDSIGSMELNNIIYCDLNYICMKLILQKSYVIFMLITKFPSDKWHFCPNFATYYLNFARK